MVPVGLGFNTLSAISLLTLPVFAQGIACTVLRANDKRTQVVNANDPTDRLLIAESAHRTTIDTAAVFVPLILLVDARTAGLASGNTVKTVAGVALVGTVISRTLLYLYYLRAKSLLEPSIARSAGTWGSYIFGAVLSVLPLF
ncbi:hypothetical protein HDU87_003600 [Geranomyces variabilis]|uniref:MAPEG family protein n=1 Tax=Geranomyces variabilis TaxID=109894 RepID=A0AAD5TJD9_9FUNG|nr:hypothetical protein HDU87_003600 [Geranomyces variabilis]